MLIAATAKQWNVSASECTAANSTVIYKTSVRKLTYGDLAKAAAGQPVPDVAKLLAGRGLGIAFGCSYGGHVAQVVELSVDAKKHITVHKITVVADIGPIINMSGAENQAQGGSIDALSTAMGLEIEVEQGRIKQTNFTDYPILRICSAPPVEVHFLALLSLDVHTITSLISPLSHRLNPCESELLRSLARCLFPLRDSAIERLL